MKFIYQYRTSDNVQHQGFISAVDRESAFAELKKNGVKPAKLEEAPGILNKVIGKGKRWIAIVVLSVVALGLAIQFTRTSKTLEEIKLSAVAAEKSTRHQIYGDPATLRTIESGSLESTLPRAGDRLLAWFAQPGRFCVPKGESIANPPAEALKSLERSHQPDLVIRFEDPREVKELKQIINWMRSELSAYLANGNGTIRSYYQRLVERTNKEQAIYNQTKKSLENERSASVWEQKNESLRRLGIQTIPMPDTLED